MEYRTLGNTGIVVSRLCFGTLSISPLQRNLPVADGGRIMAAAIERGVNFFDSAEIYGTYGHLNSAMRLSGNDDIVIAGKSYANSIDIARREINRDYIDIFLLHEQQSAATLRGHRPALEELVTAKQRGWVRAAGISTHCIAAVRAAALTPEIDVIHPLVNVRGIGIADGTLDEMLAAIRLAKDCGKGIYAMKTLGGGHLYREATSALSWAIEQQEFDAIAVGIQDEMELQANCALFEGQLDISDAFAALGQRQRSLHIHDWCSGCGACVARCASKALRIEDNYARCDTEKCVLCGYCASVCPEFCIKVL